MAGFDRTVMRAVVLLTGILCLLAVGRYFARDVDTTTGLAVVLMSGVTPGFLQGSTNLLSDIPFAACVWGVLLVYDRRGDWTAGRIALATLLLVGGLLFRLAGVALLPAIGLFWLLNRREEGVSPLVPLLVVGLGGVVALLFTPVGDALTGQLALNPLDALTFDPVRIWRYRLSVASALLYPFPGDLANDLYHVLAGGIALVGLGAWIRNRWRTLLVAFSVAYLVMLSTVSVTSGRYLWVLLPVIALGFVQGLRILSRLALRRWTPSREARGEKEPGSAFGDGSITFAGDGTAALGVIAILVLLQVSVGPRETSPPGLEDRPEARELFEYLGSRRDTAELRVAFVRPRVLSWETGLDAMPTFAAPPETLLAEWTEKRITHVVTGGFGLDTAADSAAGRVLAIHPHRLERTFANREFVVYRFVVDTAGRTDRP